MSEIWKLSATQVAHAIAEGDISSREAVEASLERLAQVEPHLNAFSDHVADAVRHADEADVRRARGESLGALHGVPIAVKENHDLVGFPTTHGVPALRDAVPARRNGPPVERYVEAGAVIIGRTRMPPFGQRWTTQSDFYGPTRNPYDPSVTAGGSTGGGAAAVAAGVVSIAQGNDMGGSLRYPASVCGVTALRPTVRKVPWWTSGENEGIRLASREFLVDGPLARNVADLRLALSVIARPDARDPEATPGHALPATDSPRIGVVVDPGDMPFAGASSPEVDASLRAAAATLRSCGYEVDEISVPALGEAAGLWLQMTFEDYGVASFASELDAFGDDGMRFKWNAVTRLVREEFGDRSLEGYLAAVQRRSLLRRTISELMVDYPVLLLPNSGEEPFGLGGDVTSLDRVRELLRSQWPSLSVPFMALPGVGLATQPRAGRAPLGVHLIGRAFDEETILRVAEQIEATTSFGEPVDPVLPVGSRS
ncbi:MULTISPECIES: amidase [unclassified Nocardioides]|uniref:amidase n=1 Tax=unclassified Nocardioides TaxID=2615069 RepID=UPI000A55FA22|nr:MULTISPECIES: amidase [unclassified Nocardioides]